MGRILEALKQAEAKRRPPVAMASTSPFRPAEAALECGTGEEIPFIEVGAPGSVVEASPLVLAAGAARAGTAQVPRCQDSRLRSQAAVSQSMIASVEVRAVTFEPLSIDRPVGPARFAPELVAFHHPEHPLCKQYVAVLSSLATPVSGPEPQVLLFTAADSLPGKTTVVLNLAITVAKQGKRVVAVDAGASPPAVAQRLGLEDAPGLGEVLEGAVSLQQAVQATGLKNLEALTAGAIGGVRRQLVVQEAIAQVLQDLRPRADIVLVDAPAWEDSPGLSALARACDAVYLVTRQAEAKAPRAVTLVREIPGHGGRLCGSILIQP